MPVNNTTDDVDDFLCNIGCMVGNSLQVAIDFEHDTPALQEDMAKNIAFIEEEARRLLA